MIMIMVIVNLLFVVFADGEWILSFGYLGALLGFRYVLWTNRPE